MTYDFELYKLTQQFIIDYPASKYPELLTKNDRPHYCLLIETHCDYFICVPFRTNITHNNAYKFKNTKRSKQSNSGIDYSKMVIIKDTHYLDEQNVVIDQDEYNQAMQNIAAITTEALEYLETYIAHVSGVKVLHEKQFKRRYEFTTLQYFHDILNINTAEKLVCAT